MRYRAVLLAVTCSLWVVSLGHSQGMANRLSYSPGDTYAPSELSFDLFGFHGDRDKGGSPRDAWGYGADVSYYITRYFGVAAETYADAFEVPYLVDGMALIRYPIGSTGLAPYAFAGGGRQWDHAAQWLGFVGGGLEFRFNAGMGVFGDIREVLPDKTPDYAMIRFGLRLILK